MQLTVIGSSGSVPSPMSAASCYLVTSNEGRIVLDLGHGALGPLQAAADVSSLSAVIISHLHPDHWIDLTALLVLLRHGPVRRTAPLPLYGPAGLSARIAAASTGDPSADLSDVFEFHRLGSGREIIVDGFAVTPATVAHPGESYAFRVSDTHGRVLAYSGDTAECESLVALARGCDLALFEASYVEPDSGPEPTVAALHMSAAAAGRSANRAGASALIITHTVDWGDDGTGHTRELAQAAKHFAGPISLAVPGLACDV